MITVALRGGLGNQMFQYAIGRYLAIKNKTKLRLDLSDLEDDNLRTYELYKFNICADILKDNHITKIKLSVIRKFRNRQKLLKFIFPNLKYFWQEDMYFHEEVIKSKGNVYLDGYWQCEDYFKDIKKIIINDFKIKNEPDINNKEFLKKITNSNSVCLHIRRSDYVTNTKTNKYHGTCTLDYYKKSIEHMEKKIKNPVFFVFSDDQEWAKHNIKISHPTFFVDINNIADGHEDIRLMSNCKHFIIANSSFSWWGAWLSSNKNKIVCAPKTWFREADEGDIVPKSWIRIGEARPKVSVLMPVFNGEKYIKKSIESIFNQTFKDFEFIIINDGSTDNSLNIIKNYMDKNNRIVLVNNNKNLGLTSSLNKGLKIARGRYIARMDADDISFKERIYHQYIYLEKNRDIFLVGTSVINIDKNGKIIAHPNSITDEKNVRRILPKKNCFHHSTIMFRNNHQVFYRSKMLYCEDYDLYLRLLVQGYKLENLKEVLVKYRISSNSITRGNNIFKQLLFIEKAQEFYFQRLKYGKDKYNSFNTNNILTMDYNNNNSKTVIKYKIRTAFKTNSLVETRKLCKNYFNHYGFFNCELFYYIGTFFGKQLITILRKILFNQS